MGSGLKSSRACIVHATADGKTCQIRLLGSGAILREGHCAAKLLQNEWNIASEVWSVTSFSELHARLRKVQR